MVSGCAIESGRRQKLGLRGQPKVKIKHVVSTLLFGNVFIDRISRQDVSIPPPMGITAQSNCISISTQNGTGALRIVNDVEPISTPMLYMAPFKFRQTNFRMQLLCHMFGCVRINPTHEFEMWKCAHGMYHYYNIGLWFSGFFGLATSSAFLNVQVVKKLGPKMAFKTPYYTCTNVILNQKILIFNTTHPRRAQFGFCQVSMGSLVRCFGKNLVRW